MQIPILRIPFTSDDLAFVSDKICEVLASGLLAQGRYTAEFEQDFAAFCGAKYCVAVNSGTTALEVVLRALGIRDASVIVPTNTFLATALAVLHAGNRVIFADCDPETFSLSIKDVKARLAADTKAIILVHIGGIITPQIDELKRLCEERQIHLIEDCAHAHGCSIDGNPAGTLGVAGAFSFFPTKVLTTGEGGMISTNDEELYQRALIIRNQGKDPALGNRISEVGHNFRISEMTAVLGVQQMRRAKEVVESRRRIARFYDKALANVRGLRSVPIASNVRSTYYKYIAYLDEGIDRSEVKRLLKDKYEVSLTGEVYAAMCHSEPVWHRYTYCGRKRSGGEEYCSQWPTCGCQESLGEYPGAEYLASRHICLPVYPGLAAAELEYVVDSLEQVLKGASRRHMQA
jgi:dTDP-4-amino-4,6-dideoxygalactose transaminase